MHALHAKYFKPLLLTEFGADTIPGCHAQPPEMFSEEYQAEMLTCYIEVANSKPYVVGQHVWNLCDFKTAQSVLRFGGMNMKGVFTRDRRHRRRWGSHLCADGGRRRRVLGPQWQRSTGRRGDHGSQHACGCERADQRGGRYRRR